MKNLFVAADVDELFARMDTLTPESTPLWGKMNVAQSMAHCTVPMEMAVGDRKPKRKLIGRLLGPIFKGQSLNEKPMPHNSPTDPTFIVADSRGLDGERARLKGLIERFRTGGPAACTTSPHSFFGPLTPDQWARLMYKHVDHHLQQFGA